MTEYLGIAENSVSETVIEKSRFLTYAARVCGEDEAKEFLQKIRREHQFATHVCYAFVADKEGILQRFSDDGEPQGTAGMPILGVLKAHGLRESLLAVVRYFGGIKLGAGGLTRAYAGCAASALSAAKVCRYERCVVYTMRIDYANVGAAMRFLGEREILSRTFEKDAAFTFAVSEREEGEFVKDAENFFCGRVSLSAGERKFLPVGEERI